MPIYCEMQTENNKEFFPKCGTKEVAKSVSNTTTSAGENEILVNYYSFSGISQTGGLNNAVFSFSVTVPAYAPVIASVFNVLNGRDKITNFVLKVVGTSRAVGAGSNRNKVVKTYTGEEGVLTSVSLDEDDKTDGMITLHLEFYKMVFENSVTNTSGIIKTIDGGH
ncbi:hypothetical protein [Francisella philomiragia]|uniref:hypothetical protein n=1 Tax=Francisella philomiragia TaxID=28110 RepID=UPI001906CF49|nr:hypothetical protein [Francisella philomiragia]MBK2266962.1 hypothetical protein [Francisella philomiragia]MBK2278540.1 hypothetical protein [Francisella philomiragia]MBK2286271.1 hypothetical protein [Francisella philomiragia]MBK2288370.1 hypothetical protein [Francisella philomiragia]MBK2291083.1 hypothetical protein [Francisella philomiragia]